MLVAALAERSANLFSAGRQVVRVNDGNNSKKGEMERLYVMRSVTIYDRRESVCLLVVGG